MASKVAKRKRDDEVRRCFMVRFYDIHGVGNVESMMFRDPMYAAMFLLKIESLPEDHWVLNLMSWPNSPSEIGEVEMFLPCDWTGGSDIIKNCNTIANELLASQLADPKIITYLGASERLDNESKLHWIACDVSCIRQMSNPPAAPSVKMRDSPRLARILFHGTHDQIETMLTSMKFSHCENPHRAISGIVAAPLRLMKRMIGDIFTQDKKIPQAFAIDFSGAIQRVR